MAGLTREMYGIIKSMICVIMHGHLYRGGMKSDCVVCTDNVTIPDRKQLKTLMLSTNLDQKSLEKDENRSRKHCL